MSVPLYMDVHVPQAITEQSEETSDVYAASANLSANGESLNQESPTTVLR